MQLPTHDRNDSRWLFVFIFIALVAFVSQGSTAQPFFQPPPVNKGMEIQVGKWMEIQDNPSLVLHVFTIECWVKAQTRFVIASRDWPGNYLPDWSVVYEGSRKRIEFMTGMNSAPDEYFWTPDNSFTPGVWNHLALVVNGPAGTAKVYINASLSGSFSFPSRSFTVVTGLAWGGYFGNSGGSTGTGIIDEARYWSDERTQSEIQSLKNINIPDSVNYPKLHGWWRFCDNYDDSSMKGNHGTPRNNPPIIVVPDLPIGIFCGMDFTVVTEGAAICVGDTVQLSASAIGNTGPYTYRWWPDNTLIDADTPFPLAFPSGNTTYYVEVTDSKFNVILDSAVVTMFPELVVDAGPDREICGPGDVQLFCMAFPGTPPYTFSWNPDSTLSSLTVQNPIASPPAAGTYTYVVHVTDRNGCRARDTVRVIMKEGVAIDAGPDIVHCGIRSVMLNPSVASGKLPLQYTWTPESAFSDNTMTNPVVTPYTTTTYFVHVMDADSCVGEDSITVFVYPEVLIETTGDTLLCTSGSVPLSLQILQGTAPFSITWSPMHLLDVTDPKNPIAYISQTTTCYVQVVDANGCMAEDSVTIVVKPGVLLSLIADTLLCAPERVNASLKVLQASHPLTIVWSPGDSLDFVDSLHVGIFIWRTTTLRVTVIDANGCIGEEEITVTVRPEVLLSLDSAMTICRGDDAFLNARVVGGNPPYDVQWEPASSVSNPYVLSTTASCDSLIVFTVHVTDQAGCEATDSIVVRSVPKPEVDGGADRIICPGDTIQLAASASAGEPPYRWNWTPTGSIVGLDDEQSILVAPANTTAYVVSVMAANGCIGRDTVLVTVVPIQDTRIQPSGTVRFCEGDSVTLEASPGLARYEWWFGDTLLLGNSPAITVSISGSYFLRVWSALGCFLEIGPVNVVVSVPTKPVVTADGPIPICAGDSVQLKTTKAFQRYEWRDDSGRVLSANPLLNVRQGGRYIVTATNTLGCYATSDPFEVVVVEMEEIPLTGLAVVCRGDTAVYQLAVLPSDSVEWIVTGGQILEHLPPGGVRIRWDISTSGMLRARVRRLLGSTGRWCDVESDLVISILDLPEPIILAGGPLQFCEGDSVTLHTTAGMASYRWITPAGVIPGNDSLVVHTSGRYRVEVTNTAGCTGVSEAVEINVVSNPDIQILGPRVVCAGMDAVYSTLSPPGYASQWKVGGGVPISNLDADSIRVSWLGNGTGFVTVHITNGICDARDSIHVTIADSLQPVIVPSGRHVLCAGDSIIFDAGAGYASYQWVTPSGMFSTRSIVARASGFYRVHVRDAGGCSGTSDPVEVAVHVPSIPLVTGPTDLCVGDSAALTVSPEYTSYRWSTGATSRSIVVRVTGTYFVEAVDAEGCTAISAAHAVRFHDGPKKPQITRGADSLFSTAATHYEWYFNGTALTESDHRAQIILGAGSYQVVVFDDYGCHAISDPLIIDQQRAYTLLGLPVLEADPGDIIDLSLMMVDESNLSLVSPAAYNAVISFHASVLVPFGETPAGELLGDRRIISLEKEQWSGQASLRSMTFMVTLGSVEKTVLSLDHFDWDGAPVDVQLRDGSLRVRVCREGGDRLFDGSKILALRQNAPNPAQGETTIRYSVMSAGPAQLRITDMYGRTVRTVLDRMHSAGEHQTTIDVSDLSSGLYICILQTTAGAVQRQMIITR